jgi:hypothetical protein
MRSLLVAAVVLSSAACATTGQYDGAKKYAAPTLTLPSVQADLHAAVEVMVRNEGWKIVASDENHIEAVTPVDTTLGVGMRERWMFAIADYQIAVTRVLEAQWDRGGAWQSDAQVCTGYVYLREQEVLATLEKQAARGTTYAVAQAKTKQGS